MRNGDSGPVRLAVILASYNRREKTLSCIQSITAQALALSGVGESHHIILADDGSTDGTPEAVLAAYPNVQVIRGDGSLFWCRSMHLAQAAAVTRGCEFLLWLNDDTRLEPDALERAFSWEEQLGKREEKPCVIVGGLIDPVTGNTTYGGMVRTSWWRRTNLTIISPGLQAIPVQSMNGNFVLLPSVIINAVGNLDPRFEHAMGDMDYGLRVSKSGFGIWLLPGYVGTCPRNSTKGTFADRSMSLAKRWKHILSPKGLPVRSWLLFTRRHGGLAWPLYWLWPYVRVVLSSLLPQR